MQYGGIRSPRKDAHESRRGDLCQSMSIGQESNGASIGFTNLCPVGGGGIGSRRVTDTVCTRADKQEASGHRDPKMMDVYDHSIPVVSPSAD